MLTNVLLAKRLFHLSKLHIKIVLASYVCTIEKFLTVGGVVWCWGGGGGDYYHQSYSIA